MNKILDTVIKVEDESKKVVQDAQQKARDMKEKAEKENAARVDAARKEAASLYQNSIEKTQKEWQEKIQQTRSAQDTLYSDLLKAKHDDIEQAVDKILTQIKTPQHKTLNE
ncbi:MAG: hypothetical protein U5R06_04980 [candidate division KSB1 bacterium]|nr:hypothetical protein [candidate division KSB1 bacterium]